jgi:hypothetical protein
MHFDVREQAATTVQALGGKGDAVFDITMAYSDSTLKGWRYTESDCTWALQAEGDYLTACLTSVSSLPSLTSYEGASRLVTTATDGHITLWNELPAANDPTSSSSAPSSLSWPHRQKVHQNAILTSTTQTLRDGSTLLVTASDDNGIALSRLPSTPHVGNPESGAKDIRSTLLIPRAHAAAVTALATYRCRKTSIASSSKQEDSFYLLSASIDQRIKVWEVQVDVTAEQGSGAESVKVRKVQNVYTSVADVSCMSLLRLNEDDGDDGGSTGVLVCGVGMNVWRI